VVAVEGGFRAGIADGSARFFEWTVTPKLLKALIAASGGEDVPGDLF
jgi:hypothetical protein